MVQIAYDIGIGRYLKLEFQVFTILQRDKQDVRRDALIKDNGVKGSRCLRLGSDLLIFSIFMPIILFYDLR